MFSQRLNYSQEGAGFCPACSEPFSSRRFMNGNPICSCGWYANQSALILEDSTEKSIIAVLLFTAVTIAVLFAHFTTWGPHSIRAPQLQAARWLGALDSKGYQELITICLRLGRAKCAEGVSAERYNTTRDIESLGYHAQILEVIGKKDLANSTYNTYFNAGGQDAQAALRYGRLLESDGLYQEAARFYEISARQATVTLPVQATAGWVRCLMRQGKFQEAFDRIMAFHALGSNAYGYLNSELTLIQSQLGKNSAAVRR